MFLLPPSARPLPKALKLSADESLPTQDPSSSPKLRLWKRLSPSRERITSVVPPPRFSLKSETAGAAGFLLPIQASFSQSLRQVDSKGLGSGVSAVSGWQLAADSKPFERFWGALSYLMRA